MKMALREKSALHAQVASLQKTNFDFARSKNILQAKVMKHAATIECANELELLCEAHDHCVDSTDTEDGSGHCTGVF